MAKKYHKKIPRRQQKPWKRKKGSPFKYMLTGKPIAPAAINPKQLADTLGSIVAALAFKSKIPEGKK